MAERDLVKSLMYQLHPLDTEELRRQIAKGIEENLLAAGIDPEAHRRFNEEHPEIREELERQLREGLDGLA